MILKKLLNSQTLKSIKDFKKEHKEIFDIVIYGSAVRNKSVVNDVDFAIILSKKEKLNKKLNLSQELKSKLRKVIDFEIDVRAVDFEDFLDHSFLARKAILAEGYLILKKKFLYELFGFENYSLFTYSLKNLTNSKKVMFQYSMRGRGGEKGMLEITKSKLCGKGVIMVPLFYTEDFKEFFEKNKIKYKIYTGLYY